MLTNDVVSFEQLGPGELGLPRNSVVSLTDPPTLTIAIYHGHKATINTRNKYNMIYILFFLNL